MVRPKFQNREPPPRDVLLVKQVFVRHDKKVEFGPLRCREEVAVADAAPPHLLSGRHFMVSECVKAGSGSP